ncbi:MAG: SDR family NAD(P)-dependent oxidoreductase [Gammaproteobacteria bacterium]|nr:SDR family NAD(P)-dependent oxidoreductase [Gammaproteobacteria bacterium]
MYLHGKTAVITGAEGALGRSVCDKAQSSGARIVKLDIAIEHSPAQLQFAVDLNDADATRAAFNEIGQFDALFNLAGGFHFGTGVWDRSDSSWDQMFDINVNSLRNALKAAVPVLLDQGRGAIVNVGALGALTGQGQMNAYCAAKSVVMRITESLSEEVRDKGINVNAVLPSIIDTPANRAAMPDENHAAWVSPNDLAEVICFLGSEGARAIHGALVPVRNLC